MATFRNYDTNKKYKNTCDTLFSNQILLASNVLTIFK